MLEKNRSVGESGSRWPSRVVMVVFLLFFGWALWESPSIPELNAFHREIWETPTITDLGNAVRIQIKDKQGGLLLRQQLSATQRYRLVVEGRGGPMTMRFKSDDEPYEYLSAPDGRFSRVIAGARNIELLFFFDAPTSYDLSFARVEPCPVCKTADDLKARVLAEVPGLDTMTPIERIRALLRWAANVTDYTPDLSLIPHDFAAMEDFRELFEFFDKDIGGVSCAGMAVFTTRIFHRFGIDSFTFSYGIPGSWITHASVVVPLDGRFLIADPTFGVMYEFNDHPLDITEGLRLIRADRQNEIRAIELGLEGRDIISPVPQWREIFCPAEQALPSGAIGCKLGARSYHQIFAQIHSTEWARAGVPLDDWALLRLMFKGVFSVGDGLNPAARASFIAQLRESGIPFHHEPQ
jgi:hypothetical protein